MSNAPKLTTERWLCGDRWVVHSDGRIIVADFYGPDAEANARKFVAMKAAFAAAKGKP